MSNKGKVIEMRTRYEALSEAVHKATENQEYLEKWDTKGYEHSRDGEPGAGNAMWDEEFKAWIEAQTLSSLFFSEDWVYICTDLIASKISSQRMLVMKKVLDDGVERLEFDDGHKLNALLEAPNDFQDYHAFMYSNVVDAMQVGNMVVFYAKLNKQLMQIPAANIVIDFDRNGKLLKYRSQVYRPDVGMTQLEFLPEDILHIRRPNPASLIWGLSPYVPGRKAVLFNRYSTDYLNAFYLRQATPGMAITMDRNVNEDVALRQLRAIEMMHTGRKNQRRTMLLPKGTDLKVIPNSIADQRLIDLINQNRETIIALLKIPKHEVSLQTAGSLGSEEHKVALRNFWQATLIPMIRMIEGGFTKFFQKELGPNRIFKFDLSDVEALKEDQIQKAELARKLLDSGWSINQVMAEIYEKPEVPEEMANQPYLLIDKLRPQPQPAVPVQQPAVEEEEAPQNLALDVDSITKTLSRVPDWRETSVKQMDEAVEKDGSQLVKIAIDLFVGMAEEGAKVVDGLFKSQKADKPKNPGKKVLEQRLRNTFRKRFEEKWEDDYTRTLSSSVEVGYDQEMRFIFNDQDRDQIETLRAEDSRRRNALLRARGIQSFAEVSATQSKRIAQDIADGLEAGRSRGDIVQTIAQRLGSAEEMTAKANTIARTETLTAVSIGQSAMIENAKEVIPNLKKAWITGGDERVRDSHSSAEAQGAIDIDAKFKNGLSYPRDPEAGDAGEVINCRCTLIVIPPGEDVG